MPFTISKRTLWISLIILVIVVIITLVAIRAKSKYAYPDATAGTKNEVTVTKAVPSATAGIITITAANHGYAAGDVFLRGTTSYVVLGTPTVNEFSVYGAVADFPANTKLKPAYKTLSDALEQCNIDNQNNPNATTFNTCVDDATKQYYASMCPWTSGTNVPVAGSAPTAYITAYTNYQNQISSGASGDANSVGKAYLGIKNAANTAMITIANAARKADITGATRKYLSTVCPNYYVTGTGTATPANYSTWNVYGTAPTAAGSPTYYFDASRVKFSTAAEKTNVKNKLKEWAKYAAQYDTLNPGTPTGPLITGCNLYSAMSADGVTPNWKLAQQYGPGTVNTTVTLPWSSTETTCDTAYSTVGATLN